MTITIESRGRRHYVLGNTYPIRNELRAAGCKWDPDAKAWYSGKRETVERFAAKVEAGEVKAEASYRKLPDGSWGVLVPGTATVGATVSVRTKGGALKHETLAAVIEQTEQGSLCSVVQRERRGNGARYVSHRRGGGHWQKACITGGNCSSMGSGRSCGGHDCDGY